ncbi:hypothetical protein BU15DRAFT_53242 [Melanogaster broomeanus]|nr:hypothetical protein BU15DRAFT_53242 [Melanogaster broomeanus]
MSAARFPQFSVRNCSWHSIFELVAQPRYLWASWHPGNLGDYQTVKQLWMAWDEGTIVEGVGQLPPLQLVEKEWGRTKDLSTNKGRRQVWRPHNDNNVRRQWSQFMFFISRINTTINAGKHASQAVQELDEQRGAMSVPQLHSQLQCKRLPQHRQRLEHAHGLACHGRV